MPEGHLDIRQYNRKLEDKVLELEDKIMRLEDRIL
jgi:hypothetical protein